MRTVRSILICAVVLAGASCDPQPSTPSTSTSTPAPAPSLSPYPTITSFAWGVGLCAGAGFACQGYVSVEMGAISVRSSLDPNADPGVAAALTARGLLGFNRLAEEILRDNPRISSGGCGIACDGLTFSVRVVGDPSNAMPHTWSLSWGATSAPSALHVAYDRLHRLAVRLSRCEPDPWADLREPCRALVSATG